MSEGLNGASLAGVPPRGRLVVGFSGGADSTALAHWLMAQTGRERILLAHVNHLLRGEEAERDQAFVESFARRHGLALEVLRADVGALARKEGLGVEECGRQVRYDFFHRLAAGEEDRILTAHNADDNAETILLNLCRGAGAQGLCGIPAQRGKILRPLLRTSREEIEAYCQDHGLDYVTDSSNLANDYARNRVRNQVVPLLRELNPRFVQAAGQAAELLRVDQAYLDQEARTLLAAAENQWGLEAKALLRAHPAVRGRALKQYLEQAGCRRLEHKHLVLAEEVLAGGGCDLPGGIRLHCAQGVLWAGRPQPPAGPFEMPAGPGETPLPGGGWLVLRQKSLSETENREKIQNLLFKNALDYDIMDGSLMVRNRRPGDRFRPAGRGCSKPVRQIFQELRMPPPLRDRAPLLVCRGEIAWCPGAGAGEGFQATGRSKRIWIVEMKEERGYDRREDHVGRH